MQAPWGPFGRQCADTRVSHSGLRWRVGQTQVTDTYETCIGFSSAPYGRDGAEITASVLETGRPLPKTATVLHILRQTGGAARGAREGDLGSLAAGSDDPEAAAALARDIGLQQSRSIGPGDTLALPVRLSIPFPLDAELSCRPDGGRVDRGRETLVLACALDGPVRTDLVDAQVRLAGMEEIDVQTGVRLSSVLSGRLSGRVRAGDGARWRAADDGLLYRRDTELE